MEVKGKLTGVGTIVHKDDSTMFIKINKQQIDVPNGCEITLIVHK